MKENKKEDLKLICISILSTLVTIGVFMLILALVNVTTLTDNMYYQMKENIVKDDPIVDIISIRCNNEKTEQAKIYCVYNIVFSFYDYKEHDDYQIYYPSQTLLEGGVCRDAALTYCAIFNKMNISCSYHSNVEHIFNIVDKSDGDYCIIDQQSIKCN